MAENPGKARESEPVLKEPVSTCGNLQTCPYCQNPVELIWVHSHYQCPKCKYVVVSCCGDS
ncbi:MAG: hypothetical protein K8I03_08575 [Ignavibacteria bacterium]|nr:hypothetical protein [Ignavibacteria bacterium]